MSSRQLEDIAEQQAAARIAAALGIDVDELEELDWTIEPHESDDGVHYGHTISFGPESDASILSKVQGLQDRSEGHTSELQSLMRISYAVFCLIKKNG